MKTKLAENIRHLRKARGLTQERLAEAMGVSVSAVHKWESGQSSPELRLVLELADLFQTSTDVLLGYAWRDRHATSALERIQSLTQKGSYDEAKTEAEKALKSFPNHFEIVYHSALLYLKIGERVEKNKANARAITLMHHACELMEQNRDDSISEVSLRALSAKAYLLMGQPEAALRILKKHNVCGVNNAAIGMILADCFHDADGAEPYLGQAFLSFSEEINNIMIGYANVFVQRRDYGAAIDCLRWLRIVLRGIQPQEALTWFDKYDCVLLETSAECYCLMGDVEKARDALKAAILRAARYDHAAPDERGDMRFFTTLRLESQPHYDMYGTSAWDCLSRRMHPEEGIPHLWKLWLELKGLYHEAV